MSEHGDRSEEQRYRIVGRSMFPLCHPFSAVVAQTAQCQIGDIAAYIGPRGGHLVFHRVIGLEPDQIITRGDTNRHEDPAVPRTALIGRVVRIELYGLGVNLPSSGPLAVAQRRAGLAWGRAAPRLRGWLRRLRPRRKV